jgi:hypothetical protein
MKKNRLKFPLLLVLLVLVSLSVSFYFYRDKFTELYAYLKPLDVISAAEEGIDEIENGVEDSQKSEIGKIEQLNPALVQEVSKNDLLDNEIRKNCLLMQQLLIVEQIKESIYQDKSYDQLLKKLLDGSNTAGARKAVDSLTGIAAISHPGFHQLIEDFKPVAKSLIIESKTNEADSFFKKLMFRLIYKVIFIKKVSGEMSELERNLQALDEALQSRDLVAASAQLGMIKSEDAKFSVWREHVKILLKELSLVNELIVDLSKGDNCAIPK